MAKVTFKNVSKRFEKVIAVDNVNFHINDGEFFTLLGPSGCGKTTTLRMVAGFYYPSDGKVFFNDRDVTYLVPEARNTGMVFQNYALFPHMTVYENIAYGLQVRKIKGKIMKDKIYDVLNLVQMNGYENRKIAQLSGGQQQRVALARALVIRPDILLLDEPLSNLDTKLRKTTSEELRKLQKQLGLTAIYVTHDQEEAFSVSDRVAVLNLGKIHQIDSPTRIFNYPEDRFVAEFLGNVNLFEATVSTIDSENITLSVPFSERAIVASRARQRQDWTFAISEKVDVMIHTNQLQLVKKSEGTNHITGRLLMKMFNGLIWNFDVETVNVQWRVSQFNYATVNYSDFVTGREASLYLPPREIYLIKRREGV